MRIASLASVSFLLATLTSTAFAEPSSPPIEAWASAFGSPSTQEEPAPAPALAPARQAGVRSSIDAEPRWSLGVSSPFGWLHESFASSLSIGLGAHHAVRANFGWFNADEALPLLLAGGERDPRTGHIMDLGLGMVWYPRQLWQGVTLEAGLLRRERDVRAHHDTDVKETTQSVTYAARAMVGWSWIIARPLYIAVAAGFSVGQETGREIVSSASMPSNVEIGRVKVDPEIYLRVGVAFGR